jgi:hypothetical protein
MKQVKELAEVANVSLRRACVDYIKTVGTKKDVPFLRELRNKKDAVTAAVTRDIDAAIEALNNK